MAPAGTKVVIELTEPVSSKTGKHGDMFALKLAKPLVVGGEVLIPAGAPGMGQVVDASSSGFMGRPSKLVLAARYLEVDGRRVPLRSLELGLAGEDKTATVAVMSSLPYVGITSLLIKGGEIEAFAGTTATAKLSADFSPSPPAEPEGSQLQTPSQKDAQ
jgi:hypothetical protein